MWRFGIVLGLALSGCAAEPGAAGVGRGAASPERPAAVRARGRSYPLDHLRRSSQGAAASCPKLDLHRFRGDTLQFVPSVRVIEPFRERLLEFERVVREVSQRVYSRPPSAILVAASYGCRSVRGRRLRLSEHALGNAIDVAGFRFAPVGKGKTSGLPPALAQGFEVRVDQHWRGRGSAVRRRHARFLHELTAALVQHDTFRTLLGPAHRDHSDHFHFDMAPQHYVDL
ncbi:MAG TPA: extensin family protein [Polyangiaceae bacterium]|nr:extensin family protein [Polyangiaceae bacterium]